MRKFKVGEKVTAVGNYEQYGGGYTHRKGDTIIIVGIRNESNNYFIRNTNNGNEVNWGFYGEDYFSKLKKEPVKTELEWLDRVQDNFKE